MADVRYLLDTNIVSYWMRGNRSVLERLAAMHPRDLAIAAITLAEIHYGIEKSPQKKAERRSRIRRITEQIGLVPFDREAALHYSAIRVILEKKGTPISERDLQIVAIARSRGMRLVTHNVKEFARIPDLPVEDWHDG